MNLGHLIDNLAVFDSAQILVVNAVLLVQNGNKTLFYGLDDYNTAVENALLIHDVYEHIDEAAQKASFAELDYFFFHDGCSFLKK